MLIYAYFIYFITNITLVSILSNVPSRQTFSGFSSAYSSHYKGHDVERIKLDQFKLTDNAIVRQRLILCQLMRQKMHLTNKKLVIDTSPKSNLKWAKTKERLAITMINDEDLLSKKKKTNKEKWSGFLQNTSKAKKTNDNTSYTLHLMKLAIRDQNQTSACKLLHSLNIKLAIKKYSIMMNYLFLMAIQSGMDSLAILIMESNFPKSVNDSILSHIPQGSNQNSDYYPSYFLASVAVGSETIIKYMIKRGAQINLSWFGLSPLHLACCLHEKGNAQLVKFLIDNNADPTLYLLYQQYFLLLQLKSVPFSSHSYNYNEDIDNSSRPKKSSVNEYKKLAMHLRQPSLPPDHQAIVAAHAVPIFPLEIAAAVTNLEAVALILKKLESTNLLSRFRYPLIIQQDVDITIRLIKAGANINQRTIYGSTPLHLAARVGNIELIAVYLYFNIPIDIEDDEGWTPLHESAFFGQHEAVKYLIKQGANCDVKNIVGDTPVQVALKSGFATEEILEFFEKSPTEMNDNLLIEKKMNVEQLIAEIGDVRLGDASLRRKTRFFNFKGAKSRFTIEKLDNSVAAAILPLERVHSRSPKSLFTSLEGGTIGLRRSRTMSSGDTSNLSSSSLFSISSANNIDISQSPGRRYGHSHSRSMIQSSANSHQSSTMEHRRKCSSTSDLNSNHDSDSSVITISSKSSTSSSGINPSSVSTSSPGGSSGLSRRSSNLSFTSMSTLSRLFSIRHGNSAKKQ